MTSYEAIFRRRSIRKYKNDEISPAMLEKIEKFGEDAIGIRPDIQVKWKIFRKEEHQLKGLFRVDAPYYVVLYSEICEDYRKNAGCLMEQLSLYLFTKGIGSCYQGGAKLKKDQEKDLELVMIMAFGYPTEPLERSYEDFRRIELKKLVTIRGAFGKVQRKLLDCISGGCCNSGHNPGSVVSDGDSGTYQSGLSFTSGVTVCIGADWRHYGAHRAGGRALR